MDEEPNVFRPPYMSFQTFWRFIEELRSKPLPPQIDRSLMSSKSGTDRANLTMAFQAFDLIGPGGSVRPELTAIVEGDEQGRRRVLAEVLGRYYAVPLWVSEQNGTEQQLIEAFRDAYGMTAAETRRKSITFFLHAAREAQIELSSHFPSTRSGSGAPGVPRPRRTTRRKATTPQTLDKTSAPTSGSAPNAPQGGDRYEVNLGSGGSVSVEVSVNLFDLSTSDREFVIELVDKLKGYDPEGPAKVRVAL